MKAPCWDSKPEEETGRLKKSEGGGGEREKRKRRIFSSLSLPLPLSFFCPSTYPKGYCFYSSLIFLRHKIKEGGYNKMNINKQLSPAKNTPALQAKSAVALHIQRREKIKELWWQVWWSLSNCSFNILLFWGQCNKTVTSVIVSEGIVLESENSCYTRKSFIKFTLVYVM